MSDSTDRRQFYSGRPGNTYPTASVGAPITENGKSCAVSGKTITITMLVAPPGGWIKIVTQLSQKKA